MNRFQIKARSPEGESHEFIVDAGEHGIGTGDDCVIRLPATDGVDFSFLLTLDSSGFFLDANDDSKAVSGSEEIDTTGTFHPFRDPIHIHGFQLTIDPVLQSENLDSRLDALKPGSSTVYEIGTKIATGGMGNVFQASDSSIGRTVAVKVMRLKVQGSQTARRRFLREAMVLGRLEHPNIVPIYDFGRDAEGNLYYAMKLVRGQTLRWALERIKTGDREAIEKFPLDRLLGDYRKVCDAMAFAHSRGVIHRDLKPENIMIGEFGEVLVMDWGLAKILDQPESDLISDVDDGETIEGFQDFSASEVRDMRATLTLDGAVVGTPQFMSPEQASGLIAQIDQRSDVFALGGILYNILTLQPPVSGQNVEEVIEKVRVGNFVAPALFNKSTRSGIRDTSKAPRLQLADEKLRLDHLPAKRVPPSLSSVAMRALSVRREDRYESVTALQSEIAAFQGGFATNAEEISTWGQLKLLVKRHRTISGVLALLVVLTIVFIFQLMESEHRATQNFQRADSESQNARKAEQLASVKEREALQALAQSQITLAEAALRDENHGDMEKALLLCPEAFRNTHWQYLWQRKDDSINGLTDSKFSENQAVINHANPVQFYQSLESGIVALIGADGKTVRQFESKIPGAVHISVSPDGQHLAVASSTPRICSILNTVTGEITATCDLSQADKRSSVARLLFSPDGEHLFLGLDRHAGVFLFECATGKESWMKDHDYHAAFHPTKNLLAVQDIDALTFYDLKSGKQQLRFPSAPSHARSMIAFSPDGGRIALSDREESVHLFDSLTGDEIYQFQPDDWINDLAFSRDGRLVTLGNRGKERGLNSVISIWDTSARKKIQSLLGAPATAGRLSLDRPSGMMLTDGAPRKLWTVPTGSEFKVLNSSITDPRSAAFLDDDEILAPYARSFITLINFRTSSVWQPPTRGFGVVAVQPKQQRIAFATAMNPKANGLIEVFESDLRGLKSKQRLETLSGLKDLRYGTTGNHLVAAFASGPILLLDGATLKLTAKYDSPAGYTPEFAALVMADEQIATVWRTSGAERSTGDTLVLRRRSDSAETARMPCNQTVNSLATSVDGTLIAIGGTDRMVHILTGESLELIKTFRAHDQAITALAFHPTEPFVATASEDLTIKFWDYETGRLINHLLGPAHSPRKLCFSPSGNRVAVVEKGGKVRVWNVTPLITGESDSSPARE